MKSGSKILVLAVLLFVMLSGIGLAEEGPGHHFDWKAFLGKLLNSTLLFGSLIFFLRKPLINLLSQKSLDLKKDIIAREQNLEKTTEQLDELLKRLDAIEGEITSMKKQAEKSGSEEMKMIEELGEKESQRILQFAEAEVSTRVEASVKRLKSRIAELAINNFKIDIKAKLNDEIHNNIIKKNIEISGDIIERE